METNLYEFKATIVKSSRNTTTEIQISESGTHARYRITTKLKDHTEVSYGKWQHIRHSRRVGNFINRKGYRLYLNK